MPKAKITSVFVKGKEVKLGVNELSFYTLLCHHRGEVVRYPVLEQEPHNWKQNYYRVLKKTVEEKLEGLERIRSISGVGYLLLHHES